MSTLATPLCLPNNCCWNETTNEYNIDHDTPRTSLKPVEAALRKLRSIKGPVCVVSIVGPYRKGKSYILSKLFNQGEVFPLGHSLDPETMGMWLWVLPERYRDPCTDQEFTVVLLDSEGTNAIKADESDDHCIFTLAVLLSSVMIYNSVGVPNRSDLEGLEHITNLSQRIQVLSDKDFDPTSSRKVFPSFVWLLRDVVLELPKEFKTLRDYFIEKVFRVHSDSSERALEVEESITNLFRDFDAFGLAPPSADPQVVQNMNAAEHQREINPEFTRAVKKFRQEVLKKLAPNRSLDNEFITGEGLAMMTEEYVKTLNTPGSVPCIQSTWKIYVQTKCAEAYSICLELYKHEMEKQLRVEDLPCDDKKIRRSHHEASELSHQHFEFETFGMELANTWKFLRELADKEQDIESTWLKKNSLETEAFYRNREAVLRRQYLYPVLECLYKDRRDYDLVPTQLYSAYSQVGDQFQRQRKGSKALFENLAYVLDLKLQTEMRENLDLLLRLKKNHDDLKSERVALQLERDEAARLQRENASIETDLAEIEDRIAAREAQHTIDQEEALQAFKTRMNNDREEACDVITERRAQFQRECEAGSRRQCALGRTIRDTQQVLDEQGQQLTRLQDDLQRTRR